MPWTVFLPAAVVAMKKVGRGSDVKKLAAWAFAVLVFFTLSSGKRNLYVLMAYPAMALMIGGASISMVSLSKKWRACTVAAGVATMVLMGAGAACTGLVLEYYPDVFHLKEELPIAVALFYPPAAMLLLGSVAVLWVYRRHGLGLEFISAYAAVFILFWMSISLLVFPALNEHKTPIEVIPAVSKYAEAGDKMIIYGTTSEIVPLYCGMRSLSEIDPDALRATMRAEKTGIVVFREKSWLELKDVIHGGAILGECTIGHKTMVLYGFGRK